MASFVQFGSKDEVLQAFKARSIDVWAICQGKELICAGDGADELETFLDMLNNGRHPVIYTLRVYNGAGDADCITNKTECNGSFKFQLESAGAVQQVSGVMPRFAGGVDAITQRIHGAISEKVGKYVDDLLSGKEAAEKKPTFKDIAIGYLENPEDLQMIMGTIGSVVAMFKGVPMAPPAMVAGPREPQRFAGAGAADAGASEQDAKGERLCNAINRLEKCDPDIVIHLEQLATIAETKPAIYTMALNFLKG
jgi:hypothetical protein